MGWVHLLAAPCSAWYQSKTIVRKIGRVVNLFALTHCVDEATRRVAERGYPVRAIMMPVIPIDGWQDVYTRFTDRLLQTIAIQRLTLGGICIYRSARDLMERKMGMRNAVSQQIGSASPVAGDGRARYSRNLRHEVYSLVIASARRLRPDLEIALCLEEEALWESTGLRGSMGRCNCRL